MSRPGPEPLGVVLAGGAGRRFVAGAKVTAVLGGATLLDRAVAGLTAIVGEVVVCARGDTELVPLSSGRRVAVWREPDDAPRHPLSGIAAALRRAGEERAVLVCAVDLPFAGEGALAAVLGAAAAAAGETPIVIAAGQPLLGLYRPAVAGALREAAGAGASVRTTVAALGAREVPVPDPARTLFNINSVEDLRAAEALLASGG